MRITEQSSPLTAALDLERLDREAESAYWLLGVASSTVAGSFIGMSV